MAKTTKKTATRKSAAETADDIGRLVSLPLDLIDADSFDNQRTGDFTQGNSKDDGSDQSFAELVESMSLVGQKDPVTVRPRPSSLPPHTDADGNPTGAEYQLVKGFRRFAARNLIAQRDKERAPTINVIIKELTDLQALEENVFENTARDSLTGPDLAWAAFNLQETYKLNGIPVSDNILAKKMGKNQSYISKIKKIVVSAPGIAKKWQDALSPLTVDAMADLAKLPPDQQEAEYERINAELGGKGNKRGVQKPPLESATKSAERIATMLGAYELQELIIVNVDWHDDLEALGVVTKDLTMPDRRHVAAKAREAYEKAKTVKPAKEKAAKSADENGSKEIAQA